MLLFIYIVVYVDEKFPLFILSKYEILVPKSINFFAWEEDRILILITAVLYSAPSRKSTQERSQPNLSQTI